MKAKNILMSILLAMGFIAAKAAAGYPPELALVSQPVLVYNYNSITVYYDVQNIGDYAYRGHIYLYLSPDNGYYYADKYVKVCPGRIKRVAIEIPAYRPNPSRVYTIMPYYELDDELYSFTTFEYFEPLSFYWNGPHNEPWVVYRAPSRVRYYNRPGSYRYYYDGFRPPMPPPAPGYGPGPGMPPPMNPMHHTYNYHHNNGGYPGSPNGNPGTPPAPNHGNNPPAPNNGGNGEAPNATVRPNANSGSMSHGNNHSGNNTGGSNVTPPAPNNNNAAGGSNSGRTGNNGNVNRPSGNSNNSGTTNSGSNSGRTGNNSNVSRPSSNSNNSGTTNSGSNSRSGSSSSGSSSSRGSSSNSRR